MSDEQPKNGWTDPARRGRGTGVDGAAGPAAGATAASTVPGPRSRGDRPDRAVEVMTPNVTEHLTEPVPTVPADAGPAPEMATGPVPGPVPGPGRATVPTVARTVGDETDGDKTEGTAARPPVTVRPRPRMPRQPRNGRIGPWAPVAGATVGVVAGIVVALLLRSTATSFDERLSLVFVVLALALLGAGATLLADETRLMRRGAQAAEARSQSAGLIAGLLNGLTPARLMVLAGGFVLLLSAYVARQG
ncbi:hypothetical protein [Modestobacter sp. NPDC049651]|uniref:hypothetical protein n=1 Tax=unclassified Modestobacter TaxID=2643866 RepID=UPI0034035BBB